MWRITWDKCIEILYMQIYLVDIWIYEVLMQKSDTTDIRTSNALICKTPAPVHTYAIGHTGRNTIIHQDYILAELICLVCLVLCRPAPSFCIGWWQHVIGISQADMMQSWHAVAYWPGLMKRTNAIISCQHRVCREVTWVLIVLIIKDNVLAKGEVIFVNSHQTSCTMCEREA